MAPKASAASDKTYLTGDIVLAKVKGYPSWPGQIIDNEMAPPNVKRDKPTKTKTTYLVRFFPTGDYAWTASRDLSSLTTREIEAYVSSPAKKSGDLLTAYKIARDPTEWQRQRDEAQAEYETLQAAAMEYVDELHSGDEDDAGAKKSKKRKSESGKAAPADKKSKKAKLEQMAKSRSSGGASRGEGYGQEEPERVVKKSKPIDDSEDPGLKQVKDWRHKLQKVFLGKTPPSAEDMLKCKEYFEAMEDFDMNKEWLAESKLAKVLKRICLLKEGEIPDGDRYKFKERSSALALKWSQTQGTGTPVPSAATPAPVPAEPTPETPAAPAPPAPAPVEDKPVETNGAAPVEVEDKVGTNGTTEEPAKSEPAPEQAAPDSVMA